MTTRLDGMPAMNGMSTPRMSRPRRGVLLTLLAALPALCLVFFLPAGKAQAHGAPMNPGSRTYLCWENAHTSSGALQPDNPACADALAQGGSTPFYNWFAVLRSDGAGRTEGFIPDGELCSGGTGGPYDFTAFNQARSDWPYTRLTSGAQMQFAYNAWAAHPGTFHLYVTKDGYDPNQPLGWDDLEDQPFASVTDPQLSGSVGTIDGKYTWTSALPANKSGRHIIYMVWSRSDSNETFYSCSDVAFDGGNGEVVFPGSDGGEDPGDPGEEPTDPGEEPTDPGTASCTAAIRKVNDWGSGHQGEVTVTNRGDTALSGWTVHFELASGQRVDSLWNASPTYDGANVYAQSQQDSTLAPGQSATFGYVVNGGAGDPSAPHCMPH
ncbi:chitin-binding protein [Streptomyces pini]|uniref:Chitin-binding protein n=2 Tax=Streptomyces pini TaxID=1520580 RepID=A0A1I4DI62_9ACTN|nr:chitin-binding protein [Streptomyces pini]